jgi:hypothetical protein
MRARMAAQMADQMADPLPPIKQIEITSPRVRVGTPNNMAGARLCSANKTNGEKCVKFAMVGLSVCEKHGGYTATARIANGRAKAAKVIKTEMEKFATPLDIDDIRANPIVAFETEFRRTVGRIIFLDEQISKINSVDDLTWGRTKEEDIQAAEFAGTNVTKEARANALLQLQMVERKHLLDLEKIWIGAKLDVRKLEIEQDKVRLLDAAITGILTKLGHDVTDPGVRMVVRDQLMSLPSTAIGKDDDY